MQNEPASSFEMDQKQFQAHLTATLQGDPFSAEWTTDETIVPSSVHAPTDSDQAETFNALSTLPSVSVSNDDFAVGNSDFRVVRTLGEGGMGIVQLAEQQALKRLVALKTSKSEEGNAHRRMLEEAQILGSLDHPNVVPVYVLGTQEDGSPVMVMKRIDGVEWSELLDDPELDFEDHLRVLLQVCNALRFAHNRGIIHRDIKPDNVMVGDFGEVYLLDWGVALSLAGGSGLPTPENAPGLAGTPAYMAPEMAATQNERIDQRTDVYLLGAVLHELLTGGPPHTGNSLMSVCFAAFQSEPKNYDGIEFPELGQIASRAMAKEIEDRYDDVAAFADALESAIDHQDAYGLARTAGRLLEGIDDVSSPESARKLIEAEFGFRQALAAWSENDLAKAGLNRVLELTIARCISVEDFQGARAAYEQLDSKPLVLLEKIQEGEAQKSLKEKRVGHLEKLEFDHDLRTGTGSRFRFAIICGVLFSALASYAAFNLSRNEPGPLIEEVIYTFPRLLGIVIFGFVLFRKKLLANIANRRLTLTVAALFLGMFSLRLSFVFMDTPLLNVIVAEAILIGVATSFIGLASGSLRIAAAASSFLLAALAGAYMGSAVRFLICMAMADVIYFGVMAWVWRPTARNATD